MIQLHNVDPLTGHKVVEYFAYQLVSGYGNNATIKGFLNNYDFYFFPVVNPDGECNPLQILLALYQNLRLTSDRLYLYPKQ